MPVTDDDDDFAGPVSMAATQSTSSKAEQRKSNKPIMEKRRRARINHCLNELKSLILNAMKKDPARHSKLEKADILEMTVKHLQTVQRQQLELAVGADPTVINKFRSGFDECAAEVNRYISRMDVEHAVKQRLSAHLHRCVSSLQQMNPPNQPSMHDDNNNSSGNQRTLLIPSRLPTGELALVLPNYNNQNSYLSSASNSAFTAVKNPDHYPPRFQPFKVEIPNSHLTAHISIPDAYERRDPAHVSPNKRPLPPPNLQQMKPQHPIGQNLDRRNERLFLQNMKEDCHRLSADRRESHRIEAEKKPEMQLQHGRLKPQLQAADSSTRLHDLLVNQKPNPNYHLNPKLHSNATYKFMRNSEAKREKTDSMEPPNKMTRFVSSTGHVFERRSSVIVNEAGKEGQPSLASSSNQPEKQNTQGDMWRPW